MSILPLIKGALGSRHLRRILPKQGKPTKRPLYITARAYDELFPERAELNRWVGYELADLVPRLAKMEAALDNFVAGRRLVHDNDIKKLRDMDEIWVLCERSYKPGLRAVGRFVKRDVFIVTNIEDRGGLGEKDKPKYGKNYYGYGQAARICSTEWERLFLKNSCHTGKKLSDYIGKNCHEKRKFLA